MRCRYRIVLGRRRWNAGLAAPRLGCLEGRPGFDRSSGVFGAVVHGRSTRGDRGRHGRPEGDEKHDRGRDTDKAHNALTARATDGLGVRANDKSDDAEEEERDSEKWK